VSTTSNNPARTVGVDLEQPIACLDCSIRDRSTEKVFSTRSTAGLILREKYSFLTLYPVRLLV
jgi:hypothetical protein